MSSNEPTKSKLAPELPHGELQTVFENIWFVQGQVKMPMKLPAKISRSMTVLRDAQSGDLTLVNSMRLSKSGLDQLADLGPIKHVIRLGGFHGRDDLFYREKFNAQVFAIQGQSYSRSMELSSDSENGYMQPDVWVSSAEQLPLSDCDLKIFTSSSPPEAALLLKLHGGILITADSLQNTPAPDQFVNFPMKLMMKKFGFWKAYNVGPGWLQFAKPSKNDVQSVMQLDFEHVLPGHGQAVINDAKNKFAPVVNGELKGCHS